MKSYFEFNVALNGHHLFATAPRSFPNTMRDKAKQFFKYLCEKYPENEWYSVSVTEWVCVGYSRTLDFIKEVY